ncbi:Diadenosine tetraphosphatase ApaH/serine/threonine protein phosphatase, PP2A family [Allokutzneria albata]|uniref:Diadenosine tetraphosphatase ApaH/serine/threonine protein phosphatase, PP2A family n=1 Tax=Allokutzneria albata TaxID=211114 RepID=A0A1G9YNA2_ALLAB|nr:Diadenosine tetraphosphatase ApaH/serine/threonine protein phosphatase, PP2A family [Allokutzneria albata]
MTQSSRIVRPEERGPFDVIGDVHGCQEELLALLDALRYELVRDAKGRPVDAAHRDGRKAVFVGDLVDRGPDTPGVLRLAMGMVDSGNALVVCGNHDLKLARALRGDKVSARHGLAESLDQLAKQSEGFRERVLEFLLDLPVHLVLDDGGLVIAHAGLPERLHGVESGRAKAFALYGDTTGETDANGLPVRLPWAEKYRGAATVLYGHTPVAEAKWVNNAMCLDTGCVFGGRLTAFRYPEQEIVDIAARRVWYRHAVYGALF